MTIIQLEYIIAVDTHRHFGKAAEACFVTQPTLSMQIQKLEEQLNVIIFDRTKQPVIPTEIGKRVIAQARLAVSESRKVIEIVNEEKGEISGELRIGIIPTLAPYLLPLFVHGFVEKYPKVTLIVEELITQQVIYKLGNQLLDIGIIVTPYDDAAFKSIPLFYEEFYAYVSHRGKLFQKESVSAEDLPGNEIWLLNEGHCFREQVLNICNTHSGQYAHFRFESGSLEALKRIVDKHDGLTLLPELATLDLDKTSNAKLKPFTPPKPVREVSLITHNSFLRKRLLEVLYKEILASIPDYINIKKYGKVIKWK